MPQNTPDARGSRPEETERVEPAGLSRREFLRTGTASSLLAAIPVAAAQSLSGTGQSVSTRVASGALLDLLRPPETILAYTDGLRTEPVRLVQAADDWHGGGIDARTEVKAHALSISLSAPKTAVERLHLRWRMPVDPALRVLGDAWERSYGDLGWRGTLPERVLPWYFATVAGQLTHCYGVQTQPGALCFWQLDPEGVSLWLDVSNGGRGVLLGARTLHAATVVSRRGLAGEEAFAALQAFCRQMCSVPSRPAPPIYGFNDWYYAYGHNTAARILADTDYLASLSSGQSPRPFSVVDDGWENRKSFPDMAELATQIKVRGVRPGLWIRPLQTSAGTDPRLLLAAARFGDRQDRAKELAYDPTIPEARASVLAKVEQAVGWGYELIKHDFSTYELLGQWGFEMGATPTQPGWSLHDRSRTNAEVILDLYQAIRASCAPATLILGCNTIGHLGQGLFDAQRTGDDTSGRLWERTRRMGVNTLAFRLTQHGTFFILDADCVGISPAIPWELNRQWLDLLARSGTAVFVSPGEGAREPRQAAAITAAFALAAQGGSGARAGSWMEESTPSGWVEKHADRHTQTQSYDWCAPDGAWPFTV